jgi:CRP-like cAMP-binding protein
MSDPHDLATQLARTWFAAELSDAVRERLAAIARRYDAPARQRLLREGEETRELSVLLSGRVALTQHVASRDAVTLMTVEPGDVFGWSALIPPYRATSTVVSLEPVSVIAFAAADLRERLGADPQLAAGVYPRVLEVLGRRLGASRQQLLDRYGTDLAEAW